MKRFLFSVVFSLVLIGLLGACGSRPAPVGSNAGANGHGVIILHDDPKEETPQDLPGNDPAPSESTDSPAPAEPTEPEEPAELPDMPEEHTHSFGAWIAEIPATCTQTGTKAHKHCAACGKDFDESGNELATLTIPTTEHIAVTDPAVLPTCKETGLTEGSHCELCGKIFVAQEILPTAEHSLGAWNPEIPATCAETGVYGHFVCTVCGKCFDADEIELENLTIPCVSHRYKNGKCEFCGGYKASKNLAFQSNGNGTCFLYSPGACLDSLIVIPSVSPDGETVTGIGESAFLDSLCEKIVIPESVVVICSKAIYNCAGLTEIVYLGSVSEWNEIEKAADWKNGPIITITCKDGVLQQ